MKNTTASITKCIDFKFICSVCIWYGVLEKINKASMSLQKVSANVDSAILALETVQFFLLKYKANGFEEIRETATKIALENEIEPVFATRVGRKRHQEW